MAGKFRRGKIDPEVAEKRRRALDMRKAGRTFDAIATEIGYANAGGAYKAVMQAIQDMLREPAEAVLSLELERLDRLMAAWWNPATGGVKPNGQVVQPSGDATDRVLRIMRQRADLLGLNVVATKKVESSEEPIDPDEAAAALKAILDVRESKKKESM